MIAAERNPEARALAHQFEEAVQTLSALLERCSADQWRTICPEEGWTVGVTAHHVAGSFRFIGSLIEALAAGNPLPEVTAAGINEGNARHAVKYADCDQGETIAGLRAKGAVAAQLIAGLSDEQLENAAPFTLRSCHVTSARRIIERMLIGHVESHRADIEAAIGSV
ncbi:MAG: DinB family protein [Chloroflexota bacterium]